MCAKELLRAIEECRSEMVQLASATSYTNHRVVKASSKLDQLLNKYYTLAAKKRAELE
ncbi:aspartyl-phosphate phosphatase Spo0E family protein [Bacillus sp. J33]|uniref:aspartyl-phosphate phosphatase Spo0E family protein n=1 Tax=Bacillus sp. J33 TaxID=935836 RepID=UPI0004B5692A|nr:aspartyl-phosphate phosphatase Spo0E family protein [Bacillus sp. J33]